MDMQEIRQKFPQYSDLDDKSLLTGLHNKYYSDIPFDEFSSKITGSNTPDPTTFQKAQSSFGGRVLQGIRDPIDDLAVLAPKALQGVTSFGGNYENPVSKFFGDEANKVQSLNKQNEAEYQQSKQATNTQGADAARFTGNVVSPVNMIPATRLAKAATLGERVLQGAKVGAAAGVIGGDADTTQDDFWLQKAKSGVAGAAIGGALPGVITGASRVISPETRAQAAALLKQGITPTIGQIMGGTAQKIEDKLQSVPFFGDAITRARGKAVEDFNKTMLNRALSPIGEKVSTIGREGVQEVKDKLLSAYNKLLPSLSFKPDQQFRDSFDDLMTMTGGLGDSQKKELNKIVNDVLKKVSPNGSMDGETFKIVESQLNSKAKNFTGSTDAYQKELGDALAQTLNLMRENLVRSNPSHAAQLKAINTGYANYARIRQAANSTNVGANEGIISPTQLAAAVRQLDKSAGKGASATGKALMQDLAEQGTTVLGSKVADSGTAGRVFLGTGVGGVAGSVGMLPQVAATLGLASAPYLARKTAAALMTKRPDKVLGVSPAEIAKLLRQSSPAVSGAVPFALQDK